LGASVDARPVAAADACPALADEDVGKSVALAPDVPAQAASSHPAKAAVQASAAVPCTPDVGRSAEQSCAALASSVAAVLPPQEVQARLASLHSPGVLHSLRVHSVAPAEAVPRAFAAEPQALLASSVAALSELPWVRSVESYSSAPVAASAEPVAE
jgi:hypothetical protein